MTHPMKLTPEEVAGELPPGVQATATEVASALELVDQDAEYDTLRSQWTYQVWDRTSPINGVPAVTVGEAHGFDLYDTDHDIVLLRDGGRIAMIQEVDPAAPSRQLIPRGQGGAVAEKLLDVIVLHQANASIVRQVEQTLRERAG